MKLLVLAQTPPPVHGQSVMVRTLVEGLPGHGIAVHHVNLGLSHDAADIGRWRIGKIFSVVVACARTVFARFMLGCDVLYYVPAPAKRGALYRDWTVMFFCRIFFRHTVLHWHATGLSAWLQQHGSRFERTITQWALGRASLSIALGAALRADAEFFKPKKIAIVPNGIAMPPESTRLDEPGAPVRVLFVGLCSEEKGFFATVRGIVAANRALHTAVDAPAFTLTAAGEFPDRDTSRRFHALVVEHPFALSHVGPVHGEKKTALFQHSHAFCLPTRYAAEGQPLVLIEAMAHDLAIITTRWRGIPEMLPPAAVVIEPGDDEALLHALLRLREQPPQPGVFRAHFQTHFTARQHLQTLARALDDMVL